MILIMLPHIFAVTQIYSSDFIDSGRNYCWFYEWLGSSLLILTTLAANLSLINFNDISTDMWLVLYLWELMEQVLITNAMHNMRNQMRGPSPWKHKNFCDTSLSRPASEKLKTIVFTDLIYPLPSFWIKTLYVSKPYFKSICWHILSFFVYSMVMNYIFTALRSGLK